MRPVKEPIHTRLLLGHFKLILKLSVFIILLFCLAVEAEEQSPAFNPEARFHPVTAQNGMVVSEERYATEAGLAVLREGGNAVDAAVTAASVLRAGPLPAAPGSRLKAGSAGPPWSRRCGRGARRHRR